MGMDVETTKRAMAGVKPDLIGWDAIAAELGVTTRTAKKWAELGAPVFNWGPTSVAAYADRLRAWAATYRMRRAA